MRRLLYVTALLLAAVLRMSAQDIIRVEAPEVVAADEQFNVTFVIEGEKSPSDFSWSQGDSFQLVWGPQKGSSTSIQIINGKRSSSRQTTFTYILMPTGTGTFSLPEATAKVGGTKISSQPFSIQVVSDGASSSRQQSSGGGSGPDKSSSSSSGTSSAGTVSDDDIFLKLSVNRSQVVIGEPVTATQPALGLDCDSDHFSNYFVDKDIQYKKIMDYLDKQSLKPTKDAWKNGYHLSVKFGNIEIDSENTYNNENEKDVIFSKLDKIILPVIKKEKDTYDKN